VSSRIHRTVAKYQEACADLVHINYLYYIIIGKPKFLQARIGTLHGIQAS
jgi:hypothetical protein